MDNFSNPRYYPTILMGNFPKQKYYPTILMDNFPKPKCYPSILMDNFPNPKYYPTILMDNFSKPKSFPSFLRENISGCELNTMHNIPDPKCTSISVFLFSQKFPHLSLNLWRGLCTKGFEHGRDFPNPSHISPVNPPVRFMLP